MGSVRKKGIRLAVARVGSQARLAEQLGVTQQAVSRWLGQGWVPLARVVEVEMATGVPRRQLLRPAILQAANVDLDRRG